MDNIEPSVPAPATSERPKAGRISADSAEPKSSAPVFDKGDFVVYPAHGVGRVMDRETRQIAGGAVDLVVISFEHDRLTVRVPVARAAVSGLRKLSSRKMLDSALATLKGRPRTSRGMWNRRALEYGAKINSGDPVSIAEVVRDLHRNAIQPEPSYSERRIYETALDRLARELAMVERIPLEAAAQKVIRILNGASRASACIDAVAA
jgi:CarD family transcriptional regulator